MEKNGENKMDQQNKNEEILSHNKGKQNIFGCKNEVEEKLDKTCNTRKGVLMTLFLMELSGKKRRRKVNGIK